MQRLYRSFKAAEHGNIAMISAIAFPVVLMFGIGAVDYGIMSKSVQDLKQAASAAALAAVNEAQIAYTAREDVDLEELMQETALRVFQARTEGLNFSKVENVNIVPKQDGNKLSAVVNYNATYSPQVMNLVGPSTYKISDSQRATVSTASYISINLVFDVSASMGVGATEADQRLMQEKIGCTFGCHQQNVSLENSTYGRARAFGATMRIDVARDAAYRSLQILTENSTLDDQVSFGLYKYGSHVTKVLDAADANAVDMNYVRSQIDDNIFLNEHHSAGTSTEVSLAEIGAALPASGSGRTPDDRVQYLVVMTDGVDGYRYLPGNRRKWNTPNGYGVWAPNGDHCSVIRDKGIHILFVHTEYLAPDFGRHTHIFNWIDANINPTLDSKLADCTGSEDYVFQASTPEEIDEAFQEVMSDISTPLRLY